MPGGTNTIGEIAGPALGVRQMKKPPEILNAIVDIVLAHKPDKKAKAAKRKAKAKKKAK
jgi:hypothetical protein